MTDSITPPTSPDTLSQEVTSEALVPTEVLSDEEAQSRLDRFGHAAGHVARNGVITMEVLPTNGVLTLVLPEAAALLLTHNSLVAAGAVGLSTTLLEGVAGVFTAKALTDNPDSKIIKGVHKLLNNKTVSPFVVSEDGELVPVAEGLLALYGGTPAAMVAKESVPAAEPRTYHERKRYALKTAGILGAICTLQGFLWAEGITNLTNPKVVAPIIAAAGVYKVAASKIKKSLNTRNGATTYHGEAAEPATPRYDLSPEEFSELESQLVAKVEAHFPEEGVYAVWMNADNEFSNLIRTNEASYFPEVKELPQEIEDDTRFLGMVDTRQSARRLVHGSTVSGIGRDRDEPLGSGSSGFTTIDELIELGNFTTQEFEDFYTAKGYDTSRAMSVDTNFRVGGHAEKVDGLKVADLAYLSLFQATQRLAPEGTTSAVFASINDDSIKSFDRVGVRWEHLMDREDIQTPEAERDLDFTPVAIPVDDDFRALFRAMNYEVPELELS